MLSQKKLNDSLIVFDLDDTLIAEGVYLDAAYKKLSQLGLASYETLSGYRNAYAAIDDNVKPAHRDAAMEIYRKGDFPVSPVKDARQVLEQLKFYGATLAIITDGWSVRQRNKLTNSDLITFFDFIYISEEHENKDKLSGEPFQIMDIEYPQLRHKVYIGDNPAKDFIRAKSQGWRTIMIRDPGINYIHPATIKSTEYQPDITLKSLSLILSVL